MSTKDGRPKKVSASGIGKKGSQVAQVVEAILAQVRMETAAQFQILHNRIANLEKRIASSSALHTLGRYRDDAREVLMHELGRPKRTPEQAVKKSFDMADMMDSEYTIRMANRKAEIEAQAAAEAEKAALQTCDDCGEKYGQNETHECTSGTEDDDGDLLSEDEMADIGDIVGGALERREGSTPEAPPQGEEEDES